MPQKIEDLSAEEFPPEQPRLLDLHFCRQSEESFRPAGDEIPFHCFRSEIFSNWKLQGDSRTSGFKSTARHFRTSLKVHSEELLQEEEGSQYSFRKAGVHSSHFTAFCCVPPPRQKWLHSEEAYRLLFMIDRCKTGHLFPFPTIRPPWSHPLAWGFHLQLPLL